METFCIDPALLDPPMPTIAAPFPIHPIATTAADPMISDLFAVHFLIFRDNNNNRHIVHLNRCIKGLEGTFYAEDREVWVGEYLGRTVIAKLFNCERDRCAYTKELTARQHFGYNRFIPDVIHTGTMECLFGPRTEITEGGSSSDGDGKWMVVLMEYAEGQPFGGMSYTSWPQLSDLEKIAFKRDLIQGIYFIRQKGVVWKDACPPNVIWNKDRRRVMLVDWEDWEMNIDNYPLEKPEYESIMRGTEAWSRL